MPGFVLLLIEQPDIFLAPVEVKPANRFAVVVIEQHAAIALRVPHDDAFDAGDGADDGLDDVEAFQLLFRRGDLVFDDFRGCFGSNGFAG